MAKQPDYRLQTLLGLREKAKSEAERHLGDCLRILKEEEERLEEMRAELRRMTDLSIFGPRCGRVWARF